MTRLDLLYPCLFRWARKHASPSAIIAAASEVGESLFAESAPTHTYPHTPTFRRGHGAALVSPFRFRWIIVSVLGSGAFAGHQLRYTDNVHHVGDLVATTS